MAGMVKEEFKEEVLTELSWIMNVIDDLCTKTNLETYETVLIKNRVQMQEEKAINKFIFFNFKNLDTITIDKTQEMIAKYYYEMTKRKWSLSDEVVQKLISLKLQQLKRRI
ncbi:hypothetical protein [Caviibacter abscessus]|uniref:hypothetical protein n=1 Tax=Caviibacter abscessus TaxID=1766719 RepID=UPI000831464C|nr:hypothetical protein [Caviibacter abscessus]